MSVKHTSLPAKFLTFVCLSGSISVLWGTTPTTTVLTTSVTSSPLNAAVTLTATVTPNLVTGKVTFYDGATIVGVGTSTLGVATASVRQFLAGHRLLRAYYQGDSTYSSSYSAIVSLNVQAVPSGSTTPNYGDGFQPESSPVIGDFNNDGAPDVVTFQAGGSVLLLLSNGVGGFISSVPITGLNNPFSMVAADFNADGKTDLAISDTFNSRILVYLGNGDGTFQTGVSHSVVGVCFGIAAGDFNGDGVVDIATEDGSDGLSLFINNGDGTFQSALATAIPGNLYGLAMGDFNGDGVADLALANNGNSTVDIVFGSPTGFSAPVSYAVGTPAAVTVADFNGDQIVDLAVINNTDDVASLLLGNANGTFQAATSAGAFPAPESAIVSGDLDGDGFMDFVATGSSAFCILMGKGDGTFYSPYCGPSSGVLGVAIGSLDATGKTGIVVAGPLGVFLDSGGPFPPSAAAGNLQNIQAGSSATPLEVQLTDYGHNYAAAGIPITFQAPIYGPGGYFAGSGNSAVISTVSDGTATAPAFVSNSAPGSYAVVAGPPGSTVSFSLTNTSPVIGPTPCSFAVSPAALAFNSAGGTNVVSVVPTPSTCGWSINSDSSWITPSGTDFTGSNSVTITAPVNLSGNTLAGNLVIAGQYVTVAQWGTAPVVTDAPAGVLGNMITDMVGYGFSSGCNAVPLDYCPASPITRAEAAVLLVRGVYGSDNFSYSTTPHFNDVSNADFGFAWIQKLFELGISSGCGGGSYCPSAELPRDQAAILVVRSRLGAQTPFSSPSVPYFTDVPDTAFGFSYIQRLRWENITSGCAPTTYCPSEAITREQLAVFIMRGLTNQFRPLNTALISQVTAGNSDIRTLAPYGSTTLTLSGQDTHFDPTTSTIVVAGGIATSNFTVYSPTYATVDVTGSGNTTPVDIPESIIITTGAEDAVSPNPILFESCPLC